jgi:tRNA 2-selenouridine synthase
MSNPGTTDAVDRMSLTRFDMIIDVRSPAEFAEDRVPGAVNLPVLDNAERAIIGTTYVQESRFLARRMGAALVARNVARHLEAALKDAPPTFRPLIYCWRGGQRSNAMALILAQVGWRTTVLQGGYKTYRRNVQRRLYDETLGFGLILLDGNTGCGKTDILKRAAARGAQVLDLEALARHRGSLFGALADTQPAQKWFESSLVHELSAMDPSRPVLVEAESNKIGKRTLPPALWQAMLTAGRIELSAPVDERVRYLIEVYPEMLDAALTRLDVYPGRKQLAAWRALADAGQFEDLVREVVERHYDPSYLSSSKRDTRPRLATIELGSLSVTARDSVAQRIAEIAGAS